MSITVGQLMAAANAFGSALNGLDASGIDLTSLSQDAVLGEDILSIVSVFWPPAALIEEALAIAVAVAPLINVNITPDPWPERDAQTSTDPHSGRG